MKLSYRAIRFACWLWFRVLHRHKVYGHSYLPKGPAIIASSHASFYDPSLLTISTKRELHYLARETLFRNSFFGWLIRSLNAHPLKSKAGNSSTVKTAVGVLDQGHLLLVFPEGKRSWKGDILPLQPGTAMIASLSGYPVIPAYLPGSFQVWPRHNSIPKLWGHTACVFGTPLYWEDYQELNRKEALRTMTADLEEAIIDLKQWYEKGAIGQPP